MVVIPFIRMRNLKGLNEPNFFNKIIWIASEIKYPALTLQRGPAWTKHLGNVINIAYRAFLM
jgi:hypothetical protein